MKACQGSVTVFFSMIFLSVLVFLYGIWTLGKSVLIRTDIRRDIDAAAFSVLAEYDQAWVREYGLYVIPKDQLEQSLRFYLNENCGHAWGSYELTALELTEARSLQSLPVLQQQILAFMEVRGFLNFIEEAVNLLQQVQEKDKQVTEENEWQDMAQLQWIQNIYAQMVTNLEGIRQDGYQNPFSINLLLKADPAYEEVKAAVGRQQPSVEDVAVLEKAYYALDQTAAICRETVQLSYGLEGELEKLKNTDLIPVTTVQLQSYRACWEENAKLCAEASQAIQTWLKEAGEHHQRAIETVNQLCNYERSIHLPYEYREKENSWDFTGLLSYLKGYTEDISRFAPNKELDLGLIEKENSEGQEIGDIGLDGSFKELFLITEYAMGTFQNLREILGKEEGKAPYNLRGEEKENRYLSNEIEYLIVGKANEYQNVEGSRQRLIGLRVVLNMAYLLTDTEKRLEIEAIANTVGGILLPGIGNGIAFGVLLTAWSYGEAIADYRTLLQGGGIPIWKTEASWQTSLSNIISMDFSDETERREGGLSYEHYMRLLLYMVGQETLLSRIQDLLYLNHQKKSMDEYITGFSIEGAVQHWGKERSFSGAYQYEFYR